MIALTGALLNGYYVPWFKGHRALVNKLMQDRVKAEAEAIKAIGNSDEIEYFVNVAPADYKSILSTGRKKEAKWLRSLVAAVLLSGVPSTILVMEILTAEWSGWSLIYLAALLITACVGLFFAAINLLTLVEIRQDTLIELEVTATTLNAVGRDQLHHVSGSNVHSASYSDIHAVEIIPTGDLSWVRLYRHDGKWLGMDSHNLCPKTASAFANDIASRMQPVDAVAHRTRSV